MGVIILNNKSSRDYGIIVELEPDYEVAERAYDVVSVPGRGDVLVDLKYYKNVERPYKIAVVNQDNNKFTKLAPYIAEWLNTGLGYVRLEDSYNPDQFVKARITGSTNVFNILSQVGRAEVIFDRQPKRWLKSGENKIPLRPNPQTNIILNPTSNEAKPLLKLNITGKNVYVEINGKVIAFTGGYTGYINIDLETLDVSGPMLPNLNQYVYFPQGEPTLVPGTNTIFTSSGISDAWIEPRWWVL